MTERAFSGANTPADDDTLLAELEAELSRKVEKELLTLTVPNRPRMKLTFDPSIEFDDYKLWVKRAKETKKDDAPNMLRLAFTVLSFTTRGMKLDDAERTTRDGVSLPLTSPHVHRMANVAEGNTREAIRWIFGSDGHIIQAMQKIVEAAGYSLDGDVEEVDPSES